jgi:hypothetical protein
MASRTPLVLVAGQLQQLQAADTLAIPPFVASGASHAAGAVPDPGATAGTTRFLREDATFAVPSASVNTVYYSLYGGL